MTVATVIAWGRARWPWVAGALVLVALIIAVKLYGNARYDNGRDLARADIADSIGKVYDAHYQSFRDSTAQQIALFTKGLAAANARADSADVRAARAQAQAAQVLTPTIIAKTPPEVLALIGSLRTALDSNTSAMKEIRTKLDTANALIARQQIALTLADTTIAQKNREIEDWKRIKNPPKGFWRQVLTVAKFAGAVATGVAIGAIVK